MKILRLISKILILAVGLLMLMLSVDVFELEGSIFELIWAFMIHALPGLLVLVFLALLWKKEKLLGLFALISALTIFLVFGFYRNMLQMWSAILSLIVPLVIAGILLLLRKEK
jgi:cytochrome bd-type quinol oxidase subunit 2